MHAQSGFDIDYGTPTGKISGRLAQAIVLRRPLDVRDTVVAVNGDTLRVSLCGKLVARIVDSELLYVTFADQNTTISLGRLNVILKTLTKHWRAKLINDTGVFVDREHNNKVIGSVYINLVNGHQVTPQGTGEIINLIKELDISSNT